MRSDARIRTRTHIRTRAQERKLLLVVQNARKDSKSEPDNKSGNSGTPEKQVSGKKDPEVSQQQQQQVRVECACFCVAVLHIMFCGGASLFAS